MKKLAQVSAKEKGRYGEKMVFRRLIEVGNNSNFNLHRFPF